MRTFKLSIGATILPTAFLFASSAVAQTTNPTVSPTDPTVISAHIPTDKFVLSDKQFYGPYNGRSINMNEVLLGGTPNPWLYVWAARQFYIIKGRARTSRMRLSSDSVGFRAEVKKPNAKGDYGMAVQYQYEATSDAKITAGVSGVKYGGTGGQNVAVIFDHERGLSSRAGFLYQTNHRFGESTSGYFGVAKEFPDAGNLSFRGQAELAVQGWKSAVRNLRHGIQFKPILTAEASYRLLPWMSLQADVTVMPMGVPFYAGSLSGLGGFMFYEPGGVAGDLRRNTVGYGSLRLLFHWKK